jgi:hypothetical protein
MFDNTEILETIEKFKNLVIEEAKGNLQKKNASGNLSNSIRGETKVMANSIRISFDMDQYGWFQDLGVSGKKTKYNTPFSYKSKMPPPRAFDKWVIRKGIAPRDASGKFKGRSIQSVGFKKSITFLIARSIFYNGIKPSLFFTKPFQKHFKTLGAELQEKYGLSMIKLFDDIMQESLKKFKND